MSPEEYEKLERIDGEHWFYCGKRAIVRHWISRHLELTKDDLLIDAGCGTGRMAAEMAQACRVIALDDHEESISLARPKIEAAGGEVIRTGLHKVGLDSGCAAVVTLLDVLEHIRDDRGALMETVRLVRPGGLVVITVPAMRSLWSDWDEALHHCRRYSRPELLELVTMPDVEVLRCAYFNALALPAIFPVRTWRKFVPPRPGAERAEDRIPPKLLNSLLNKLLVVPACWGWFRPPLGVSLLAVLRKRHG